MTRLHVAILCLALCIVAGCDRGPGDPPGLEDAEPLITEFARAAKRLDTLAADFAAGGGNKAPSAVTMTLTEFGKAAGAVLRSAERDGSAGVEAVQRAVAAAADEVVRHLVSAAGGHAEGSGADGTRAPRHRRL